MKDGNRYDFVLYMEAYNYAKCMSPRYAHGITYLRSGLYPSREIVKKSAERMYLMYNIISTLPPNIVELVLGITTFYITQEVISLIESTVTN